MSTRRSPQRLLATLIAVLALAVPFTQARHTSALNASSAPSVGQEHAGLSSDVRTHVADTTLVHLANAAAHAESSIQSQAAAPETAAAPTPQLVPSDAVSRATERPAGLHALSNAMRGPPTA